MHSKIFQINYQGRNLNVSTYYKKHSSELILFLHGLGCTKEFFSEAFEFTKFKDFSLLAVDLIGFGNSSKPKKFSYSIEDQAKICKLLLNEIEYKLVNIVGHSMGAAVGLVLAGDIQSKVASFANVEGNLIWEDCELLSGKIISVNLEKFRHRGFAKLRAQIKQSNDSGSKLWIKLNKKPNLLSLYRSSESLVEWSKSRKLLKRFKKLRIKKVYFYGDKNYSMKILDELDHINKIEISNSGHFVMKDNPQEFYAQLERFIK